MILELLDTYDRFGCYDFGYLLVDFKKINRIGNGGANEKLHPYIAKLDNNGTHLTLSYAESDASIGNTALKGYENSTLELDGLHYCVRYCFSSVTSLLISY